MILKTLLLTALFSLFSSSVFAQSVTVTAKKEVYKRTGADVPDFKQEFEVNYPLFSGNLSSEVLEKLRAGTDYWKVFDMSLEENLVDDHWLSNCDYEVKYNRHNILDIWLSCDGVAAYPDGSTKYLVFDLGTGNRVDYSDIFDSLKFTQLTALIRSVMKIREAKLRGEERSLLKEYREQSPEFYPGPDKIELTDLAGFTISDRGVTFIYDYNYAHVAQALEPDGSFFLSYSRLKPFIRREGLLGRFVR